MANLEKTVQEKSSRKKKFKFDFVSRFFRNFPFQPGKSSRKKFKFELLNFYIGNPLHKSSKVQILDFFLELISQNFPFAMNIFCLTHLCLKRLS